MSSTPPLGRTVGSSDVAPILGLSPYSSPWQVWGRLVGLTEYDSRGSDATRRGVMLEPYVLERYAAERGVELAPGPPIGQPGIAHPRLPWAHARPDAFATQHGRRWVVEAKTARRLDEVDGWGPHGSAAVPDHYRCQAIWLMACTELERVELAAFGLADDAWRVYAIDRDLEVEHAVLEAVAAWHERHVVGAVMPDEVDTSDECRRVLNLLWPESAGPTEATQEALELLDELRRTEAHLAHHDTQRSLMRARLRVLLGAHDELVDADGRRLATCRISRPARRVDLDALRREAPDLVERHTHPTEPRRMLRLSPPAREQQ